MPDPVSIRTPADFLASRMRLTAWCRDCGHHGAIDMTKLPPDLDLYPLDRLGLKCRACGSTEVGYIVSAEDAGRRAG